VLGEVEHWCAKHRRGTQILEGFHAVGTTDAPAAA